MREQVYRVSQKKRTFRIIQAHKPGLQAQSSLVSAFYTGWGLVDMAANYYSDVLQEAKVAVFFQALNPNIFFVGPNRFKD